MENGRLKISLLQFPLFWERPKDNMDFFGAQIAALKDKDQMPDLVVLPEMWSTGFSMDLKKKAQSIGRDSLHFMMEMAQSFQIAVVGSTIFEEDLACYNRLFFVFPDGTYESYDKRHTFSLAGESEVYEKGKSNLIVHYRGFKICPLICYDLRFPVWSRNTVDYDLLLYVANWPAPRIHAWDTLLQARAIENMAYCIGLNRVGEDPNGHQYPGHSAVYNVFGEVLCFSKKSGVLEVQLNLEYLQKQRAKFPFLKDADQFNIQYSL